MKKLQIPLIILCPLASYVAGVHLVEAATTAVIISVVVTLCMAATSFGFNECVYFNMLGERYRLGFFRWVFTLFWWFIFLAILPVLIWGFFTTSYPSVQELLQEHFVMLCMGITGFLAAGLSVLRFVTAEVEPEIEFG